MLQRAEMGQRPRLESQNDLGYLLGRHGAEEDERQIWTSDRPEAMAESDFHEGPVARFANRLSP